MSQSGNVETPGVVASTSDESKDKIEALELNLALAKNELERRREQVDAARAGEKQARGDAKAARNTIAELKAHLGAAPDLVELKRLREEVSLSQSKYESLKKDLAAQMKAAAAADREKKAAEAHFKALESTAALMQRARDAAQVRESQAFQRVAELDRDLAKALQAHADLEVGAKALEEIVFAVAGAHEKGHPEPISGCALCSALGRKVADPAPTGATA